MVAAFAQPLVLKVAQFGPDMPAFDPAYSQNVRNVIPRTPESFGPMPSMVPFSGALSNRCQGSYACLDSGDNVNLFAGDSADLYQMTVSNSPNWSKVSNGTSPYSIPSDEFWAFVLFGPRVIASDCVDAMQTFTLDVSTDFADLANGAITALALTAGSGYTNGTYALSVTNPGSGTGFAGTVTVSGGALTSYAITNNGRLYPQTATIAIPSGAAGGSSGAITPTIATIAPTAKYLATAKSFLLAANTTDAVSGTQVQRVWWSALNDPTNWPTPGTAAAAEVQSDYNDLFGEGGAIQGIVGNLGNADAAVFMEHAVWRLVYAGPPAVFDFFPALGVKGCPAPGSIIQLGNLVYYLGEDGFYSFDGANSNPIGANRVDKTFFADLDQSNIDRINATVDPVNKLIIWAYPGAGNVNGNPNHLLLYNWQIDRLTIVDATVETLTKVLSFGYTIDQLYTVLGYTFQTLPYPLDSRVWTGGLPSLACFDTSHKLNYFSGPNMAATVDTAEVQPFPGRRALVKNARPLADGGAPSVAIGTRNRTEDAVSYGTATALNSLGTCPQRANGRYIRAEITLPAGATWSHIQGVELEITSAGVR